ncbi:MAG: glycosyltransferase family 39 protein [Elusimicrobia bacterium]|nr:glycosyltransferase family 39 protein [Elusimicrobiota bacterium]
MSKTSSSFPSLAQAAPWLVFALALGARLAYAAWIGQGPAARAGDALEYHLYAVNLLDHGRYQIPAGLAWRTPGYPLFLAGIYSLFGRGVLPVQLVQCLLGAGACLLTFLIARESLGSLKWAAAAGLATACYHDLISPCARLLTEAPATFLVTAVFWLLARNSRGLGKMTALGAGALLGAAFLMRSEVLLFLPILMALQYFARPETTPTHARFLIFILASFSMFLLPWALRNQRALGRPVITGTAGSFNLYAWGVPRTVRLRLGGVRNYAEPDQSLDELKKGEFYRRAVKKFYKETPLPVLARAILINLALFYYPFHPGFDPTLVFFLPLAFAGIWMSRKEPRARPWAAWVLYLTALHLFVAVGESRHRQKLGTAVVLLSFLALKTLREKWGEKSFSRALWAWSGANLAVWVCSPLLRRIILSAIF